MLQPPGGSVPAGSLPLAPPWPTWHRPSSITLRPVLGPRSQSLRGRNPWAEGSGVLRAGPQAPVGLRQRRLEAPWPEEAHPEGATLLLMPRLEGRSRQREQPGWLCSDLRSEQSRSGVLGSGDQEALEGGGAGRGRGDRAPGGRRMGKGWECWPIAPAPPGRWWRRGGPPAPSPGDARPAARAPRRAQHHFGKAWPVPPLPPPLLVIPGLPAIRTRCAAEQEF